MRFVGNRQALCLPRQFVEGRRVAPHAVEALVDVKRNAVIPNERRVGPAARAARSIFARAFSHVSFLSRAMTGGALSERCGLARRPPLARGWHMLLPPGDARPFHRGPSRGPRGKERLAQGMKSRTGRGSCQRAGVRILSMQGLETRSGDAPAATCRRIAPSSRYTCRQADNGPASPASFERLSPSAWMCVPDLANIYFP